MTGVPGFTTPGLRLGMEALNALEALRRRASWRMTKREVATVDQARDAIITLRDEVRTFAEGKADEAERVKVVLAGIKARKSK
jgi:hypothetical protein